MEKTKIEWINVNWDENVCSGENIFNSVWKLCEIQT